MPTVNYITRPYFFDVSLELINELKKEARLNYILIIPESYFDFFGVKDPQAFRSGSVFNPRQIFSDKLFRRCQFYFEGVNVICKYEHHKESRLKNVVVWRKLFNTHASVLKADLNIIETLNIGDWYFLYKTWRKKKFHIVHDPVAHSGEKRRRLDVLRKVYFPFVDQYLTYSDYSSLLFASSFEKYRYKILTLRLPVYSCFNVIEENLKKEKKNKIVFFGRISPYKGTGIFYKAASLIAKEFPEIEFVIAGKTIPNYDPEFIQNNIHPNITIKNAFISSDELADMMNSTLFCVLPYLEATQSGVIMTCYAFNVPVLVSNCPGLVEYCFDTKNFSFEKTDVEDLSGKMKTLILNPTLLASYKEKIGNYQRKKVSQENAMRILKQACLH